MQLVTITKDNSIGLERFIDQYNDLLRYYSSFHMDSYVGLLLNRGETLFLLLDDENNVIAGRMMRKNADDLKDGVHLPKNVGRVALSHDLVASPNYSGTLLPGIELQRRAYQEFKSKAGAFADVDVIAADITHQNLLSWHKATQSAGLKTVMRKDLPKASCGKTGFFVAATADPSINLVPEGHESDALTGNAIYTEVRDQLRAIRHARPGRADRMAAKSTRFGELQ